MAKQISGWIFLTIGVALILWGVWASFDIFKSGNPAPQIFKPIKTQELKTEKGLSGVPDQIQDKINGVLQNQMDKIIPAESIPEMLNLIAWSVFMTIIIFAGGKISLIGVKMLK